MCRLSAEGRRFDCSGKGKIYGKGMNAARQRLRRIGRAAGAWTRSALSDCVVRTVFLGPDPLKAGNRHVSPCYSIIVALSVVPDPMVTHSSSVCPMESFEKHNGILKGGFVHAGV